MENFLDDRVIISEEVKKMTRLERRTEIVKLEKIAAAEKERIKQSKKQKVLG
ncbi:MAG: hypothetical protein IKS17_03895 [Firmicutes bacterium]|nr:hypothetical protein [Bacillota bacterium]